MAKKIKGFLAGTSYAPTVSTDEALLRQGCAVIQDAGISSAIVVLDDGSIWVGHPTFTLDRVTPELIISIIRDRLMEDDFATRTARSEIRSTLREIQEKSPKEQLAALSKILREHAEHFLTEAGADMSDAMRKREAELDARCKEKAA